MKVSNFTRTAPTAIVETVQKKAIDKVFQFTNAIKNGFNPPDVVRMYKESFDELDTTWKGCVKHRIRYGRQLQSIYCDTCNHYCMADYIKERYDFKVNHGEQFKRLNYTFDKFLDLAMMETALLIAKYNEVYTFEIDVAVVQLLLRYFNVYSVNGWDGGYCYTLAADDIYKVINTIAETDMQCLKRYADKIGEFVPTVQPKEIEYKKPKPTTKEDIERCISDDMTQTEIIESIMENWDVSRRTAYRLMNRYGLTRQYKKADEAAEAVAAVQQQASGDISSIDDVRTLRGIVLQQRFEIAELKAEIERLKNLINR